MLICESCSDPDKPIRARGLCATCYQRWRKNGTAERKNMKRGKCTAEGCENQAHGRGLCSTHLQRLRKHGGLEDPVLARPIPLTQHDLYPQWIDFKRKKNARQIVPEWKEDFSVFCSAVSDRASKRHRLYSIDKTQPLGPGNFEWRDTLVEKLPGESKRDYNIRASKAHRAYYADDYKNNDLTYKYGEDFTLDRYRALSAAQGHKCAVCGNPEVSTLGGVIKALAVDHCHDTRKVRGLLCQACNQGLGFFKDDLVLMAKAMLHIAAHKDDRTELPNAVKLLLNAALT